MTFVLDRRLASTSHALASLDMCEARLQDDRRFVWLVLIPVRPDAVEIADLTAADQLQLGREILAAGAAVRAIGRALGTPALKLNHGQLGNVVAQLHLHVVGRHAGDPCWPGPVWGCGAAEPYDSQALAMAMAAGRAALVGR